MMLKKYSLPVIFLVTLLLSVFPDETVIHFTEPLAINISGKKSKSYKIVNQVED
jgi:hypothetical protein